MNINSNAIYIFLILLCFVNFFLLMKINSVEHALYKESAFLKVMLSIKQDKK